VYTLNGREKTSWLLRVYILNSREGLSAVKGVPSEAGRKPPGRCERFWVSNSQPLWGLIFLLIKFYGDLTSKPTDGFGGLTPIFRVFSGVSGFGSQLAKTQKNPGVELLLGWIELERDRCFNGLPLW
jgi:hypothetical protein